MPAIIDRAKQTLADARLKHPALDRVLRMNEHYGKVKGAQQAGAITYFAFLSFFPILALGFFVIGYVAQVYGGAQDVLIKAIDGVLPHMVSADGADGTLALSEIQDSASAAGWIGLAGVLYAGLGWLSGMRDALLVVFEKPQHAQPNFIVGKVKDLISLATIGFVLILSVAVSGVVNQLASQILEWFSLGEELSPLLKVLALVVGLAANMVLFYALFRLLGDPNVPTSSLWSGALLGAVGFEILKQLSAVLIASTAKQPAFQAFGIALILLVWINYFSRVVLYSASFAYVSRKARRLRAAEGPALVQGPQLPPLDVLTSGDGAGSAPTRTPGAHRAGGAPVGMLAAGLVGTVVGALASARLRRPR